MKRFITTSLILLAVFCMLSGPQQIFADTIIETEVTQLDVGNDVAPPIIIARRGGGGFGGGSRRSGGSSWGGSKRSGGSSRGSSPRKSYNQSKPKSNNWSNKKNFNSKRSTKPTNKNNKSQNKVTKKNNKSQNKVTKKRKADKALAAKAKKSGKYHTDRKSARADFKKKNAGKYTSKYKTKPATRPSHIPQTTTVGGKSYNVTFNAGYGGYGYMGLTGWVMYDVMTDIAMMNMLMNRQGYYIANNHPVSTPPMRVHHDGCFIRLL